MEQKKKSNKIVIAVVIFIVIFGVCSFYSNVIEPSLNVMEEQSNKVYSIGDSIKCGNTEFIINEVQYKPKGTQIDSVKAVSVPELVGVIVTVNNNSSSDYQIGSNQFTLINSNKEKITPNEYSYAIYGDYNVVTTTLAPGGSKTGYIDFANTNDDNTNLQLQVSCLDGLLTEDTTYTFNISQ